MHRTLKVPKPRPATRAHDLVAGERQHMVLDGVSWAFYEHLLKEIGDGHTRVTFDQGRLEIMSPLPEHEWYKLAIHDLMKGLTLELGVEMTCLGSTTFRRKDLAKGFEPDDCYYFKDEKRMRGRKRLNMKKDPAPELIVEVDVTDRSIERQPIFAAFGVPELWRWDGRRLEFLELSSTTGEYHSRPTSLAFPFLKPADLTRFIRERGRIGENALLRKFMAWVRSKH